MSNVYYAKIVSLGTPFPTAHLKHLIGERADGSDTVQVDLYDREGSTRVVFLKKDIPLPAGKSLKEGYIFRVDDYESNGSLSSKFNKCL